MKNSDGIILVFFYQNKKSKGVNIKWDLRN